MMRKTETPLHLFNKPALARRALRHKSAGPPDNERLEWLGDSLLEFLVSRALYEKRPPLSEGEMTLAREKLISGASLSALARKEGLQDLMQTAKGAPMTDSMLAGAMEAYIAAIYLDGGQSAAEAAAKRLFAERWRELNALLAAGDDLKNPKTALQEIAQTGGGKPPEYLLQKENGKARFAVECIINEKLCARGEGNSRRAAEQEAARKCLKKLAKKK